MRIILEGTETELRNVIQFLSNPVDDSKIDVNPISDSGSDEMKALMKEHVDHRHKVHQRLSSLSEQYIPEAVVNYFTDKKTPIIYHSR